MGEVVVGIALMAISAGVMIMLVAGMEATSSQVEQKAVALLQPWLSPEQAKQYSSYRYSRSSAPTSASAIASGSEG